MIAVSGSSGPLERGERVTLVLTAAFAVTLALTIHVGDPRLWLLWSAAMVLLSGSALVLVNRNESRN